MPFSRILGILEIDFENPMNIRDGSENILFNVLREVHLWGTGAWNWLVRARKWFIQKLK